MWRPNTLAEANGYDVSVFETRERREGVIQYRCVCGLYVQAERLVDVRHLDVPQDFACDGCWTDWQRTARPVDGGEKPLDRIEWLRRWLSAHGAPQQVQDKVNRRRPVDKYGEHRRI